MLKGAIFDFDGTLFDSMSVWETAGEVYLRSLGVEAEKDLREILKTSSILQSAVYLRQKYDLTLSIDQIMSGINQTVENAYFNTVHPKCGVIPFLERMKAQDIGICIATATDLYLVRAALKRFDMEKYFSNIFTCTEVGHGKDEPIIYRIAMEHLNTSKTDTAVFEDAYYAAKTAKNDGFITVAVCDTYESRQEELKAVSDCYLESFENTDNFWELAYRV